MNFNETTSLNFMDMRHLRTLNDVDFKSNTLMQHKILLKKDFPEKQIENNNPRNQHLGLLGVSTKQDKNLRIIT